MLCLVTPDGVLEELDCPTCRTTGEGKGESKRYKTFKQVELKRHSFFILALSGGEWSSLGIGRFTLAKEPLVAMVRKLGESWRQWKRFGEEKHLLPLPGFETQIFQPVA